MILSNFLEDPFFNNLRFQMGAPLSSLFKAVQVRRGIDPVELEQLGKEGVDVFFDQVKVEPDGTLSYKGIRVSVYIRDINVMRDRQVAQESFPRFHLAYCSTLEFMRRRNRWQRYVVATRDDGNFQINLIDGRRVNSRIERLNVCQNCLALLQWNGFSYYEMNRENRKLIVNNFKITQFFERYPRDILTVRPEHSADTAPLDDYTEDFGFISERLKRERGFRCEKCPLSLSASDRMWLHVHHKNGCRSDNSPHNLEAVCYGCHANQPMHSHMKSNPRYKEFLQKFGNRPEWR